MTNVEETLSNIYNAFAPDIPAKPEFYEDCRAARGGEFLIKEIVRRLAKKNESIGEPLRFLFTGHRGCGKSSELKHLVRCIERDTSKFPVYIDFEEYLDRQDVTLEDIFLAIISEVAEKCNKKFGFKSKAGSYEILGSVGEILKGANVSAEAGLPFGIGKISIENLKKEASLRKQVREAIRGHSKRTLYSELVDFITETRLFLKKNTPYDDLVIIADTLEYINRFEKVDDQLEAQKILFIDRQEQLNLGCSVLFTVPLSLYRSKYGKQLTDIYGNEVFVLPMVKIHTRGNTNKKFEAGYKALASIAEKRLAQNSLSLKEIFEPDALEFLTRYSGGNIRTFIRFVQDAAISSDGIRLDIDSARSSVRKAVRSFAAGVDDSHSEKLAQLDLSTNQQIENGDEGYSDLLNSTAVLEYVNGEASDLFDDVWYAVNPAIHEILRFKEAVKALKKG